VGREAELAELRSLLRRLRLLTLTGPGGAGKTRLARAALGDAEVVRCFPDGLVVVELASLESPDVLTQTVAAALGVVPEVGREPLAAVIAHLRPRRSLFLLDNCEHLLDAVADLAVALLEACPGLHLLATSRLRLGVSGESAWPVPPLPLPAPNPRDWDDLRRGAAARLFLDRLGADRLAAERDPSAVSTIAAICRRLAGLPLAIELAAALARRLPLADLLATLANGIDLLLIEPAEGAVLERHAALGSVLDRSLERLTPSQRRLFLDLAVFSGGFDLEAVETVAGSAGTAEAPPVATIDELAALIEHSLVGLEERGGLPRYQILEPIRQYGQGLLLAGGEETAARDRHLGWCLSLATGAGAAANGPDQGRWFERLDLDHDNLRGALAFAADHGRWEAGLRIASSLCSFWSARGHLAEGRRWLDRFLAAEAPTGARAPALTAAGTLAWVQGDVPAARRRHAERLALSGELGDRAGVAKALYDLGNVAYLDDDRPRARLLLGAARCLRHRLGDDRGAASAINRLGTIAREQGEPDRAAELAADSLRLYRQAGDAWGVADALHLLAKVALDRGSYHEAATLGGESLTVAAGIGLRWGMARTHGLLANIAFAVGDAPRATDHCREGLALARQVGDPGTLATLQRLAGFVALLEGDHARAGDALRKSLEREARLGSRWGMALARLGLGHAALAAGDPVAAAADFRRAVALLDEIGVRIGMPEAFEGSAAVAAAVDDHVRAARLLAAAAALRQRIGLATPPVTEPRVAATRAAALAALGRRRFGAAWSAGRALSPEQALAVALVDDEGDAGPAPARPAAPALTARERQAAELAAAGATNRQIATALAISTRTAETHVANARRKLGFPSRAALAAHLPFPAP